MALVTSELIPVMLSPENLRSPELMRYFDRPSPLLRRPDPPRRTWWQKLLRVPEYDPEVFRWRLPLRRRLLRWLKKRLHGSEPQEVRLIERRIIVS